nr:NAD(+)/NADH kinase [Borreliella garinii]
MKNKALLCINTLKSGSSILGNDIKVYLETKYFVEVVLIDVSKPLLSFPRENFLFLITLGGDGTVLLAVNLLLENKNVDIPIISINMGKVGFLADIKIEDFKKVIDRFFKNSLVINKKFLLHVTVYKHGKDLISKYALNDIIIRSSILNKMIHVDLKVNSESFLSYKSDGIIVSTPTGSTGYSFSAGGPILEADLEGFLLTPISPHSVYNRSFVFSKLSKLSLSFSKEYFIAPASIFLDGINFGSFGVDVVFEFEISSQSLNFVSFCTDTFVKRLKNKLL